MAPNRTVRTPSLAVLKPLTRLPVFGPGGYQRVAREP